MSKSQTVKIDENWSLEIGSHVTLIERTENKLKRAKNVWVNTTRGHYGHVDEALKAYLRKAINPINEVSEILEVMERNINNLKSKGIIK